MYTVYCFVGVVERGLGEEERHSKEGKYVAYYLLCIEQTFKTLLIF